MTTRRILLIILWLALLLAISLFITWDVAALQNRSNTPIDLTWNVIGASGGHASSSSYSLEATLGQPIIDLSTGATTHLSAGFWQTENVRYWRVFLPVTLR